MAGSVVRDDPVCAWPMDMALGEGPSWSAEHQVLRFVDIKQGRVHSFDPVSGRGATLEIGGQPGFVLPTDDGQLLVGLDDRVCLLNEHGLGQTLAVIDQPGHNRINDGTVDPHGRLWFGTMDDNEALPTGTFWCLDRGVLHHAGGSAVVTNGPAACPAGQWLYHVDSPARTIHRSRLGPEPRLGETEVFVQLGEADGYPDGIVTDSSGCLWVALWDGWGVRRYDPSGKLLLHVPLPCARVTKVAFGGHDLRTVFITTARIGLTADDLARQPLAGSLFSFRFAEKGIATAPIQLR
jgi:xylono-1,5-lactonase